jgi:class 3 adenylate cyclase
MTLARAQRAEAAAVAGGVLVQEAVAAAQNEEPSGCVHGHHTLQPYDHAVHYSPIADICKDVCEYFHASV